MLSKRKSEEETHDSLKSARRSGPVFWWVRNDIRLEDNPVARMAVGEALADGRKLVPVLVFDPRYFDVSNYGRITDPEFKKSIKTRRPIAFGNRKCSALRARFWVGCVRSLAADLKARGSKLIVCNGKPEDVLKEVPAGSTVIAQDEPVSPEQLDIQDVLSDSLSAKGSILQSEWGAMSLYNKADLPFSVKDQMPASYSALGVALGWKDIWTCSDQETGATPIRPPVASPAVFPETDQEIHLPGMISEEILSDDAAALKVLGYSDDEIAQALKEAMPEPGEAAARKHFAEWIQEKGDSGDIKMAASWDLPVSSTANSDGHDPLQWANLSRPDGWTKVSHYMALGCISAREMYARSLHCKNATGVVHRLMWREWHRLNAIHWHRRLFWLQGPGRVERPWSSDPEKVASWKQGKTGVPYIDACIRELNQTGWLAYKGRKTAGFFLVFDMGIDWRIGAFHYEEFLLDYDVAMNYGNWVTVARVDKEKYQGEDASWYADHAEMRGKLGAERVNDPSGTYIRKWVPELKDLDDKFVHTPWDMTDEDMKRCKCIIGQDYPASVVGRLELLVDGGSDEHPMVAERASEVAAETKA